MPYIIKTKQNTKERHLQSGVPHSGKSFNLPTFIYGGDYTDEDGNLTPEAIENAGDRHMYIVSSPGEQGHKTLPTDLPHITSYVPEMKESDSLEWSRQSVAEFEDVVNTVLSSGSNNYILALDGVHAYYKHVLNIITSGSYLKGEEFEQVLYGRAHSKFGNFMAKLYNSAIPLIICTTWEEWEARAGNDPVRFRDANQPQYLWPAIPGQMAKAVVGMFDSRLSCRLEKTCFHSNCEESGKREHHVWQFMDGGAVRGVGIKGLRKITKKMKQIPFIHQDYFALKRLMEACS
jgi:hypothetical protein